MTAGVLGRRIRVLRRYRYLYLMAVPVLLFYALFHYSPMYGLIIAFKDYNVFKGILGSPWAGLYNFELVFGDDYFWKVVRNTAIISLLKLGFGFPAPIIIALLLNEVLYMGFKRVIQTIIYLPHFISWVILAGIMINILSIHGGLVNEIVELFGGTPQSYLMKPDYFRPIVTTSHIWKTAGWGSIIYLAALAGINVKLYESAVIDGAATSIASANLRDPRVSGLSCARCRLGIVRQLAGAGPALVATREKCSRGRFIFGACGRRAGVPGR